MRSTRPKRDAALLLCSIATWLCSFRIDLEDK
jgi:hypothetical protein